MLFIYEDEQLALKVIGAIHTGDVMELKRLLAENPDLVKTRVIGRTMKKREYRAHFYIWQPTGLATSLMEQ
jgi:hypothetical protein